MLCKVVSEVRIVVDYMPHRIELRDILETSEERQTKTQMLVAPIRTQILGELIDLGTPDINYVSKNIDQLT